MPFDSSLHKETPSSLADNKTVLLLIRSRLRGRLVKWEKPGC